MVIKAIHGLLSEDMQSVLFHKQAKQFTGYSQEASQAFKLTVFHLMKNS